MSKTIDVYPGQAYIPTFQELIQVATTHVQRFFDDFAIYAHPRITVELRDSEDKPQPCLLTQEATWPSTWYAWFTVPPANGGTDAYFRMVTPEDVTLWQNYFDSEPHIQHHQDWIKHCLDIGHWWYFRRSAGQPATINLVYGFIAAALAELTEGFLFSDDGAWDFDRFPATAQDFYAWYFRPDYAREPNFREWAGRCIPYISEELGAG